MVAGEAEPMDLELEVTAILCDLKRILRVWDRRRHRQLSRHVAPEIPS
jgi:hypothetical protein